MGSPAGVTGPAMAFTRLVLHAPAAWNAAFAITQLLLGAGLLWRPAVRAALAGSIVWALAVWWFGEGLGGVLSGMASPLTGAPGAVILYALLAVLAWPVIARTASTAQASTAQASTAQASTAQASSRRAGQRGAGGGKPARSPRAARWGWPGPGSRGWSCGAVSPPSSCRPPTGRPARRGTRSPASPPGSRAGSLPWTAARPAPPPGHGLAISIGLAVVFVMAGLGVFWSATTRAALLLSVVVALGIWALGENFGEIATGQGTEPSTGLLLVALAAALWPLTRRPAAAVSAGHDHQPVLAEDKAA
jgi:type II secretory pathway pseudopilin PulG